MMGHGFNNFQDSNYIDPTAVLTLEAFFQIGVIKEINRKGFLHMDEE